MNFWGSMASQPSLMGDLQGNVETLSKNTGWISPKEEARPEADLWPTYTCAHTHTYKEKFSVHTEASFLTGMFSAQPKVKKAKQSKTKQQQKTW